MLRSFRSTLLTATTLGFLAAPASAQSACVGDCSLDAAVTVDEIVTGVNIALGTSPVSGCTAFDGNSDGQVTVDEIVTAVNFALVGCPAGGEGLGVRRFSLSAQSKLELIGLPIPLTSNNFTGFLEIEAGPEDPDGLRPLALTNASEFIQIVLAPPIGSQIVICIKPLVEQFPLRDVGYLACDGTPLGGLNVVQDHNINDDDPTCSTGTLSENPFTPGVCIGAFEPEIIEGQSGPGAVAIAPDIDTLEGGLPVQILIETAVPCGDEDVVPIAAPFALNSVLGRAEVLDASNIAGNVLTAERPGENFDCANWTQEDGPGRLVLMAPLVDFDTGILGFVDAIIGFSLDD